MKTRWEAGAWLLTVLAAVVTSLILVQAAIGIAFSASQQLDLQASVIHPRAADYGLDNANPKLAALNPAVATQAQDEDVALQQLQAGRGSLSLPVAQAPLNPLAALLAVSTTLPTQPVTTLPTATLQATHINSASGSPGPSATPTMTSSWTATVTSLPTNSPVPSFTSVARSATPSRTLAASATATATAIGTNNPDSTQTQTPAVTTSKVAMLTANATGATTTTTQATTTTPTVTNTTIATATFTPTNTATGTVATIPKTGLAINFQPQGVEIPTGYLPDYGAAFDQRGNGYSYGWDKLNDHAVDRNLVADQRLDTFNAMQEKGNFAWEISVPKGRYTVYIVAGDPCCIDSTYRIAVEDTLVVNGKPQDGNNWVKGQAVIDVTDGRLTVRNASGAKNNKIDFIMIFPGDVPVPVDSTNTFTPVPTTATPTGTATATATLAPTLTSTVAATSTFTPTPTPTQISTLTATAADAPSNTPKPTHANNGNGNGSGQGGKP